MNTEMESVIHECASAYIFNLIFIANNEDEGGFDYPLEPKYKSISPLVEEMLQDGVLAVEAYEEDGESGEELVPGPKSEAHLEKLIQTSNSFQGIDCEGSEALRQAFYLRMDSGDLVTINEANNPWYEQITSIEFYKDLIPEEQKTQTTPAPEQSYDAQEEFSQSSDQSAFEIQRPDLAPSDLPTKTYLYKKPAFIWLIITAILLFFTKGSGIMLLICLIPGALTVFYGYRKVKVGPDGVTFISLLGTVHIPIEDVEETDLLEEDLEPESITITGRGGDSIRVSKWSDDLRGLIRLLKNLLEERA